MKFGNRLFQTKLLSCLSHKVCCLLSSPVLLYKFTILKTLPIFWDLLSKHSLSQNNYNFNLYEFLKQWIHPFLGKIKDRWFCLFPAAILFCAPQRDTNMASQRAKKVVSDSPGLVDSAIGQVNSVFNLPDGQVIFFEELE